MADLQVIPPGQGAGLPTLVPQVGDAGDVDEVVLPAKPVAIMSGQSNWENGLKTINGLRGAKVVTTINGLRTRKGERTVQGRDVDCTGKVLGETCTGAPDGMLSAKTGMMSSEDGVTMARYLVRCALPAGEKITVKDYRGELVTLSGELGFASQWGDGQCDETCEERVSAWCMCIEAPPGYAKIVSTPSRSRQATRMSAPLISSPRSGAAFAVVSVEVEVVLIRKRVVILQALCHQGKTGLRTVFTARSEAPFRTSRSPVARDASEEGDSSTSKIPSMVRPKTRAMAKASGKLGS